MRTRDTVTRRAILKLSGYTVLAAFVFMCGMDDSRADDLLHDFDALNFIDNREIATRDMRGNIIVLMFGSIYCKPCIALLPTMDELRERYQESDVRVIILDIDTAVDPALQRAFVEEHKIKSPYIINAYKIARANRVFMLPTTLIVNRNGEITNRIYGIRRMRVFDSAIRRLNPVSTSSEHYGKHTNNHR